MESGLTATQLKLQAGDSVQVKGKVLPDAKGFVVNVGQDSENLLLHFNPRFDCHGDVNTIVLNSMRDGVWGEEQRESTFPFQQGEKAEVTVSFDASELKVKLAEGQEISFPNRLGLEKIHFLSVEGDFKIKALKF
ncbi:16 kDa beta-galactoside-binding lectin-like [Heteronotia binoei]|uniref:16 kDa beta-galactoside-binding lectin-like n=1 Tax=Heteronotia binoei TaxID=13085 RepID=UPI002930CFD8|nr:16 kDa beta-galactoside-binding lectin-like [Heteronotia binoei]